MEIIRREIISTVLDKLIPNKVIVLLGARRVGKSQLIKQIIKEIGEEYLLFNGEDVTTHELFTRRNWRGSRLPDGSQVQSLWD